jgi:hypothetical protein
VNELEYARRYSVTQFKRYTETKEQLINDDAVYTAVGASALSWEIPKRPLSRIVVLKAAVLSLTTQQLFRISSIRRVVLYYPQTFQESEKPLLNEIFSYYYYVSSTYYKNTCTGYSWGNIDGGKRSI